ncbi:MAG: DUF2156 domain-containing protein [Candidatus Helarchaeota archaeon]|nr:DUF2156 domain-containing protein [Candidatus Helarchaeota archaeon]
MDLSSVKTLEIADEAIFNDYFKKYPPEISEFTFTNLFIWRNYYSFSFLEWEDHLLIFSPNYFKKHKISISKDPETLFFLPPVGPNPVQIVLDLFKSLKKIEIHRVPESITDKLIATRSVHDLNVKILEDRNNWDYSYEREKLVTLSGRNLYRKRRWLKRFMEKYPNYEFHLLSEEWLEKCRQLQIEWCDMNECRHGEDLMEEQKAITDAFDYYTELNFRGGLIIVDEKCIAYTLGEKLNANTGVIHIEKALADYEGAYQAINNNFAKFCCEDVTYVNREQDLGDPGLRQAKQSYVPHHMVKKSIIYRKLSH